jgi:uncharacterized protein (TIGR03435 family)
MTAPKLQAQTPEATAGQPKFEVTSVKPNKSGNPLMITDLGKLGGHFTATNYNLRRLIGLAYKLFPGQTQKTLFGIPDWIDSEHFDIEAETEGNPTVEQSRLMLQSLLADRFKLVVHHETRQLPVYTLALSKPGRTGPQLKPHLDDANCLDTPGSSPPGPGERIPSICGGFSISGQSGGLREAGSKISMDMLAATLSDLMDRPVVNLTGLTGLFDVTYEAAFEFRGGQIVPATASDPSGPPSIFTALQEQLGLKLESQTGAVDVLVIDHVERPSEN